MNKDNIIASEIYKNKVIIVSIDSNPENPRNCDNLGKMICFHNNYILGDKHDMDIYDALQLEKKSNNIVVLPMYMLDHYGLSISTIDFRDPWDSGRIGFIYADYEKIKKWFMVEEITDEIIQKTKNVLLEEVKIYDDYISGDCYCYDIYEYDENNSDNYDASSSVLVDSLNCIYDTTNGVLTMAKEFIDNLK